MFKWTKSAPMYRTHSRCTYLLAVVWFTWSMQFHEAPMLLLTSVTPMSPRWLGSFRLNKSLTWMWEKEKLIYSDWIHFNKSYCEIFYYFFLVVLTFAPTAFPRLMAFFSLCCPPEYEVSAELEPGLGLADAGGRWAEDWPGLEVCGLCCWAMEFSNILWSTGGETENRGKNIDRWIQSRIEHLLLIAADP